jgi:hypothetical protein
MRQALGGSRRPTLWLLRGTTSHLSWLERPLPGALALTEWLRQRQRLQRQQQRQLLLLRPPAAAQRRLRRRPLPPLRAVQWQWLLCRLKRCLQQLLKRLWLPLLHGAQWMAVASWH